MNFRSLKNLIIQRISGVDNPAQADAKVLLMKRADPIEEGVITYQKAHPDGTPAAPRSDTWDGPAEVAAAPVDDLKIMCAYVDGDLENKGSYKLAHHKADGQHAVVFAGVVAAAGRMNQVSGISEAGMEAVQAHLGKHYRDDFNATPPWEVKKMDINELLRKCVGLCQACVAACQACLDSMNEATKKACVEACQSCVEACQACIKACGGDVATKKADDELKDDEVLQTDAGPVRKSVIGVGLFAVLKSQQERLTSEIEKAETERFSKRAETDLPSLPGTPIEKGAALRHIEKAPEAVKATMTAILKSAEEAARLMLRERGVGAGSNEGNDGGAVMGEIKKLAGKEKAA